MPKKLDHKQVGFAHQSIDKSLKFIVDNNSNAIAVFDLKGNLKYANSAFNSLWISSIDIEDEENYNLFLDKRFTPYFDRIKALNTTKPQFSTPPHTFNFPNKNEKVVNIISLFTLLSSPIEEIILEQKLDKTTPKKHANSTKTGLKGTSLKNAIELSNIVTEVNEKGELIWANDQFFAISAYNLNDDLPLPMVQLRSGNMPASFYDNLWNTIRSGKVWKGEMENRKKTGEVFWTESTIVPQWNEDTKVTTFLGISSNITERKRAEKEIIKLNGKLEKEIEKRTEDIKTAVGELEAFSYSVSHDLRAPLRAITGFSGLLKEEFAEDMNEDATRYLKIIQDGTRQMAQLIDDLLQFSRVGRIELQKNYFDPQLIIKEILKKEEMNLRPDLEIVIQAMPKMYGDAKTMNLVFSNLILNALKFSKVVEKPKIMIGYKELENEDVFFVKDNGVGFDMRYADKLFKVFQRLHSANEFEGTGVGLAIVSRIVYKHGGRVWGESLPDSDTSFYFTLPKKTANE